MSEPYNQREVLPYGVPQIDDDDIAAVVDVLQSGWLTTGPCVEAFEEALALEAGVKHAVVVSSGTAALHAAMHAAGISAGDEVIVPAMTFLASANAVALVGGCPVFADVQRESLNIDLATLDAKRGSRTRAVVAVDFAGLPCDYDELITYCADHDLMLIDDAAHALGARYKGAPLGGIADATTFSFHPVKPIAAGEGGALCTNDDHVANRARTFRNHGIHVDAGKRESVGPWYYEMKTLGCNYRLSDLHCALGMSQLKKLHVLRERRAAIAAVYDKAFQGLPHMRLPARSDEVVHAQHLYVVQIDFERCDTTRSAFMKRLAARGVGSQVHYMPVHLHPWYRDHFKTAPGDCPQAEAAYEQMLSIPLFSAMTDDDVQRVVTAVCDEMGHDEG